MDYFRLWVIQISPSFQSDYQIAKQKIFLITSSHIFSKITPLIFSTRYKRKICNIDFKDTIPVHQTMHNYLYHHIENQQRQGIEIPIRNYVGSPHVLLQHKVMSGFELRHVSLCLWEWIHRTKRTYWKFFKENAEPSS